jgi:hypothetical protein
MFLRRVWVLWLAAGSVAAGCGSEDEGCPNVQGSFQSLYVELSGSCGPIDNPYPVPFEGGASGVNTIIERRVNSNITTDIVLKGCSVGMTQIVSDKDGAVMSQIDSSDLEIMSANELIGQVTLTRYDQGELTCSSVYEAYYSKQTAIIGAAAR